MDSGDVEVQKLIAAGKSKQAVELAKDLHKKAPTDLSRQSLVQAYVARIEQFQNKGMGQEAQTLITLVRERFPTERHHLAGLEIRALADAGNIDQLLRPLASDQTSPETRTAIESILARNVTDLPAVAACVSLPVDHPLRIGAAAVWRAFTAVTSGPVTDEEIALPEISRRSPFAAWKMLIRAIALFYRNDDAGCRRALDAIPADSAVVNLTQVVRQLADAKKPMAGIAAVLHGRVLIDDQPLRAALEKIEQAFRFRELGKLQFGIRESVRLCTIYRPGLLERLRQHISVACMLQEVPLDVVVLALGSTIKNAYFWRLMAQGHDKTAPGAIAALAWERFIRHAVAEKMFAPKGIEEAAVWLHIADSLSRIPLELLEDARGRIAKARYISSYYADQPAEIAQLKPASDHELVEFVLSPGRGFEQATLISPKTETFAKWMAWAERWGLPTKQQEVIASAWHKALARDVQPLLVLSSLAEKRKALSMALRHLADAEAVDPMNQQVRRARVRLTLSITWRHFADRKPHLVEKDLAELAALPGMDEGDRAAVLESIRGAWHEMRGDETAKNASLQIVTDRMGILCGTLLFDSIKAMAGLTYPAKFVDGSPGDQPLQFAQAEATAFRLAEDLKLQIYVPPYWPRMIEKALKQRPCPLSNADLLMIGQGHLKLQDVLLSYLASSAGLARSNPPAVTAKFLMLRAGCVDDFEGRRRKIQCLRAALELARQANDQDLIGDIFSVVDRDRFVRYVLAEARDGEALPADVLDQIIKNETKASAFPKSESIAESFVVAAAIPDPREEFEDFADSGSPYADPDDDFEDPMSQLSPGQVEQLMNAAGVSSPDEMLDDPTSLIAAMAKMVGKKLTPSEVQALAQQLSDAVAGGYGQPGMGGFGKRRKKGKRP